MFRGMEYVYEVNKEKSFSRAAHNLYISQPSLSATIKKIENRIGTPLFDRSTTPIRLTECGQEYIKCAEKILDIQNGFDSYLNNMNELKTGQLAIGASNLFASFILPPIIRKFTLKYPLMQVNLVEANTPLLEERLFTGILDIVIDNDTFSNSVYTGHQYCLDHLILAVPNQYRPSFVDASFFLSSEDICLGRHIHPDTPAVSLQAFADAPFIFLRSGNDTRKRSDKICQNQDFNPHIILKLDQQATAYHLCCYGMGITFVSDTLIHHIKPDPNVSYCRIDDPENTRAVCFYHKQSKYITRAMKEFLKVAMQKDENPT